MHMHELREKSNQQSSQKMRQAELIYNAFKFTIWKEAHRIELHERKEKL